VRGLGSDVRPDKVALRLFELTSDPNFRQDYVASLTRVLQSTIAGIIAALPLGICIGGYSAVDLLTRPMLYTLQSIPIIILGLIFLLVMGPGDAGSVTFVATAVCLSVTPLVTSAVRCVEGNHLRIARAMGMGPIRRVFEVVLPTIRPALVDVLRAALIVAWSFMAFAEVMGGDFGLGLRISELQRFNHSTDTFAYVIAITGTIILGDLLLRMIKPALCPWLRSTGA
jgi:NitT/TauT family transport system permease protein